MSEEPPGRIFIDWCPLPAAERNLLIPDMWNRPVHINIPPPIQQFVDKGMPMDAVINIDAVEISDPIHVAIDNLIRPENPAHAPHDWPGDWWSGESFEQLYFYIPHSDGDFVVRSGYRRFVWTRDETSGFVARHVEAARPVEKSQPHYPPPVRTRKIHYD